MKKLEDYLYYEEKDPDWKRSISRHIVSEVINTQDWLMRGGQKYVVLA